MKLSIFETPIAKFALRGFRERFTLSDNPWETRDSIVHEQDIEPFLRSSHKRIPPGVFTDEDDGRPNNVGDGTSKDHLARIAWLIENWDQSKNEPLIMESCSRDIYFNNGLHRCMAMSYLGYETVETRFINGFSSVVENSDKFVGWIRPPSIPGRFGESIVSDGSDSFTVTKNQSSGQVWVSKEGQHLVAKASFQRESEFEFLHNGAWRSVKGSDLDSKNFLKLLENTVSPIFQSVPRDLLADCDTPAMQNQAKDSVFVGYDR